MHYGTKKEDIQAVLDDGKYAVMSLDMCGAIAMKRHFPTAIIYVAKDKEDMIADIVQSDFSVEEKHFACCHWMRRNGIGRSAILLLITGMNRGVSAFSNF